MCIFCILLGIILTFLTEFSGSVWPAAIMHAVFNAHPSFLIGYLNEDRVEPVKVLVAGWGGMMITLLIACVIVLLVWKKKNAKE